MDTTYKTLTEWFPNGRAIAKDNAYIVRYPKEGIEIELLFRSCDRLKDVKKFKSLDITGYWIDESIEVADEVKRMLKNRIGRYPKKSPVRFGIETTNPPDVEHSTYTQFAWETPPPGPVSDEKPLANHVGFWQPPYENEENLRPGYYDDLRRDYAHDLDWISMYIDGKPGVLIQGKPVYNNFDRAHHVAAEPVEWSGGPLYVGWDNSGNTPAAVVIQIPSPLCVHVLREYHTEKMGIVDFANWVMSENNLLFPGAIYTHYADPAGESRFSKAGGGFTSNAELMRRECGIDVLPSEQNFTARVQAVEQQLKRLHGMLIDPSCTRLINGFVGGYCYKEVCSTPGVFSENVLKNKYSHVQDALQYVLTKIFFTQKQIDAFQDPIPERDDEQEEYDPRIL